MKEIINIYFSRIELLELYSESLNNIKFNKNFVIGLNILLRLSNIISDDIIELIKKILEEEIRLTCGKYYSDISKHLPELLKLNYNDFNHFLEKLDEKKILNNMLINNFQNVTKNNLDFMKSIWSFYKSKKLLSDFDSIYQSITKSYGLLTKQQIINIKYIVNTEKFPEENDTINGILNPLFEGHIIYNKKKIINIMTIVKKIFIDDESFNELNIKAMILQGILQRNFNKRKIAIKSISKGITTLYVDPKINPKKCIHNCLKIFIKIWASCYYKKLSNKLNISFKNTVDIKHILGIYYLLSAEPNHLVNFIINNVKEGDIRNLSLKLDILDNGYSFIDKRYLWLLPKRRYRLQLSVLKK